MLSCPCCGSEIGSARRVAGEVTVWCYDLDCPVRGQWVARSLAKAHHAMIVDCEESGHFAAVAAKIANIEIPTNGIHSPLTHSAGRD